LSQGDSGLTTIKIILMLNAGKPLPTA
jgi:hypothetical protein